MKISSAVSINVTNAQNTEFIQSTVGSTGRLVEFNYALPVTAPPAPAQNQSAPKPAPRSIR